MKIEIGTEIPTRQRTPDAVDLFMFSASAWLLHRIHYDLPFTSEHDGHPGLLIHGPLQGTYMIQTVQWWLGTEAELRSISYRHSNPAYLGDQLTCGGTVVGVDAGAGTFDVDLWVEKTSDPSGDSASAAEPGEAGAAAGPVITTSGTATFRLPAQR